MRKARLEAQRDGREDFVMPLLVGLSPGNLDFNLVYSAENDAFLRLADTYQRQLEALKLQRPRIEAEIKAVTDQIANQKEHLDIVNNRLADLERLFDKGYLTKQVLINQQIEKALVQAQLSSLEANVARLQQTMGDLDVKIVDLKASYERQTLGELQQTSQGLREIEATMGTARKLLEIKAEGATSVGGEPDYAIRISRTSGSGTSTFDVTNETILEPGDVIDVKLKRREPSSFAPTEAARILNDVKSTSVARPSKASPPLRQLTTR